MIIVSQDKTEIVNFNQIESIWICPNEDGRFEIEATANTNATLGYYDTAERAKEVLREIINAYKFNRKEAVGQVQTIYEMPKE